MELTCAAEQQQNPNNSNKTPTTTEPQQQQQNPNNSNITPTTAT
jgi:hypothetical protein